MYEANKRFREQHEAGVNNKGQSFIEGDSISMLYPKNNRGNPPQAWIEEIGFDDCDYIALETHGKFWVEMSKSWPLELHVPCREPLNHLMSQCNHHRRHFNCSSDDLEAEIMNCQVALRSRFRTTFERTPNITARCFDPMPPEKYVDYMGKILQKKRIESEYFHRDSNAKRHKDRECIWQQSEEFQEKVRRKIIEKFPYYQFCERCMGSDMELQLN